MKVFTRTTTVFRGAILLAALVATLPLRGQTPGAVAAAMPDLVAEEKNTFKEVKMQCEVLTETMARFDRWERDTQGEISLGMIEQLKLRANKYAVERQNRKQLESQVRELIAILKSLQSVKMKQEKILAMVAEMPAPDLENQTVTAPPIPTELPEKDDLESFEFYHVKEAANLKEISSMTDVYGDAGLWRILYNANRDKIGDPMQLVQAGTVLIIPQLNFTRAFDY